MPGLQASRPERGGVEGVGTAMVIRKALHMVRRNVEHWAVFGDIHGNLRALTAVLEDAVGQGCTHFLCTGDLVNYGPAPNEAAELALRTADVCVAGNHDELLASWSGQQAPPRPGRDPAVENAALSWTGKRLSRSVQQQLRALPRWAWWPSRRPLLLVVHGSPLSVDEYVTADTADERWVAFAQVAGGTVQAVVLGHTHRALRALRHGIYYFNPGSVGWPKDGDGRASYGILSLDRSGRLVDFRVRRVDYPRAQLREEMRRAGLPGALADAVTEGLPL
jgi:predicted phosphodiesterase